MIGRALARFLRRRGWVVFWLDEPVRQCHRKHRDGNDTCWLELYEAERKGGRI